MTAFHLYYPGYPVKITRGHAALRVLTALTKKKQPMEKANNLQVSRQNTGKAEEYQDAESYVRKVS